MKKLLLLLLFVPLVSYGQIQVSGQTPTYENPNPQPIKIQIQQNPKKYSLSNQMFQLKVN